VETLIRGATLDYLWIDIGSHQLLVANVADLAIAMGVLLLVSTVVAVYRTESTAR
jgi:lipoprotein signal peptidase